MTRVGDTINGRWKIVEILSSDSGQGNTFLVVDCLLGHFNEDRRSVIKLIKVEDPKSLERFRKEIRACLSLQHPNIVEVIDSAFENTPTPYLVMEYCLGGELSADKIKDLSLLERLRMFESICEAIAYAHRSPNGPIIHRDIKPRNIFFKDRRSLTPVVGDFGLCFFKDDNNNARATATREAVGAWEFRPPEADVGRVDSMSESADVYMLGKLLYWFLSGGEYLVREYYDRDPFELRMGEAGHPLHLAYDVLSKSIKERPEQRYPNAEEMLGDVKGLIRFAESDGRYLDCSLPHACVFCRVGEYSWKY